MSASTTRSWLDDLYGSLDDLVLQVCHRTNGRLGFQHVPTSDLDRAADLLDRLATSTCTWVGCLPLNGTPDRGRGGASDTGALVGVWADLDVAGPGHRHPADAPLPLPASTDEALRILDDVTLAPTKVLHTGGGLQAWWLLAEPWRFTEGDQAEADALVHGWADTLVELGRRRGVHVDHVGDLARILRPAGTWNRKPNREPVPVRTLVDDGPRYLLADLEDVLLPAPIVPVTNDRQRRSCTGDGPADVFGRHVSWTQLLSPHGWRPFTHSTGAPAHGAPCPTCGARVELWSHPGVELDHRGRPDHVSATGCHVLYVFSDNPATRLPVRRPLTPFRTWSLLDHGGDMAAAARLLVRTAQRAGQVVH